MAWDFFGNIPNIWMSEARKVRAENERREREKRARSRGQSLWSKDLHRAARQVTTHHVSKGTLWSSGSGSIWNVPDPDPKPDRGIWGPAPQVPPPPEPRGIWGPRQQIPRTTSSIWDPVDVRVVRVTRNSIWGPKAELESGEKSGWSFGDPLF